MIVTTTHAPGTFCWPELSTSDQAGAEKFYTGLFGWEKREVPMGPDEHYTIFEKAGNAVAACATLPKETAKQGVPPHWLSYVSTANVDASVASAEKLGGSLMAGPFDVMQYGRMAVMADPTGAAFAMWQANENPGVGVLDEDHSLVWTELVTDDTAKAGAFYSGLFGWAAEKWPGSEMDYTIFKRGEAMAAGLMKKTPEMGTIPNHWMPYFGVAHCDDMVLKARGLHASILVPPMDVPGVGRMAVLSDPQLASFAIMQFLPMPS